MNWIDFIILGVIIFFAIEGLGRSFISEFIDLTSFLLAFVISLRFYNEAAKLLQSIFKIPHSFATITSFVIVWFLIETLFLLIFSKALRKIKLPLFLNRINFLATFPAIFKSLVLIAIILIFITSFPVQPRIRKAVDDSFLGSLIVSKSQSIETPLKKLFGGVSQDTLTFLTIKPKTNEKVDLGFTTTNASPNDNLERQMINLINKERTKEGINTLKFDEKLRDIAREHSLDMFKRGYFSHYSPEGKSVANRANEADVDYLVIGENLAYAPTLSLAHNGLMNSPGHRANILSEDFNKVGIGIMDGEEYGLMITQVFSN